jgi:short-subunit dehydrogenase
MSNKVWYQYFHLKRVCITGASSGLGYALADRLGRAGVKVLACARQMDRLEELNRRYETVKVLKLDLSDLDGIESFAARAWDHLGRIDVLINNAGISQRTHFLDADSSVIDTLFRVNLVGPVALSHAVGRRMRAQEFGHLVTISSVAAQLPTPYRSVYSASKAAMENVLECVRSEVAEENMHTSIVRLGVVKTNISNNALLANGERQDTMDERIENGMDVKECAEEALYWLSKKEPEVNIGLTRQMRFGIWLRKRFPKAYRKALRRANVR